jgi:uncharacterized protein YndB with AHSA1/START domain
MNDFTATVKIARPAADVLTALTSVDGLTAWWTPATGNGEVDGELTFVFPHGPVEPTVMRVDEATTETVRWTCLSSGSAADWVGTEIIFGMAAIPSGTAVFFRHKGLTTELECFEDCYSGWTHFMQSLTQYVETGVGMPAMSGGDVERREAREGARVRAS